MNWKKFLKPDWRKIVITVILFILSSALFGNYLFGNFFALFWSSNIITCFGEFGTECYPVTVIIFIISYFLSCLIVWIYDRVRKRKGDYVHIQNINMIMGQQERDIKKK